MMRGAGVQYRPAEVRELLRLANALREVAPDPVVRKRAMLERLCRVLRANAGVCIVYNALAAVGGAGAAVQSVAVSVVRYGMTEEDAWTPAAHLRPARAGAGPSPRPRHGPAGRGAAPLPARRAPEGHARSNGAIPGGHLAESVLDVPGLKARASVTLLRRRHAGRPFTPRDRFTLDLVHSELAWVYVPDLPLVSPDGLPLSPRQRQTLQLLLGGNSEKEIAVQMGLSHNTVHHYVKAIHRHFRVSSRSELLARWVRK